MEFSCFCLPSFHSSNSLFRLYSFFLCCISKYCVRGEKLWQDKIFGFVILTHVWRRLSGLFADDCKRWKSLIVFAWNIFSEQTNVWMSLLCIFFGEFCRALLHRSSSSMLVQSVQLFVLTWTSRIGRRAFEPSIAQHCTSSLV